MRDQNGYGQGMQPSNIPYPDEYNGTEELYEEGSGTGKKVAIGAAIVLAIAALAGGGFYLFHTAGSASSTGLMVKDNQSFELGTPVILDTANFVDTTQMTAEEVGKIELDSVLMTDTAKYEYNKQSGEVVSRGKKYLEMGDYIVTLEYKKDKEEAGFKVVDTTKPVFVGFADEISIEQNAKDVKLESYWAAKDLNKVKISINGNVDLKKAGEYKIKVVATDASGNTTSKDAKVKVIESKDVRDGAALTKTKTGNIPLSSETSDMIDNGELNQSNRNDEEIKKAQEEFDRQMEEARWEALAQRSINGWQSDGKYYINGIAQTGPVTIAGYQYYFDENGVMQTGWLKVNGQDYYYGPDGKMAVGSQQIDGNTNYFDETGRKVVGWRNDETGQYYYDANGNQLFGAVIIEGNEYYLDSKTGAKYTGFRITTDGTYYYDQDGKKLFGEKEIDGNTYYFNTTTGKMATGLLSIEDKTQDGTKKTVMMDETGKMFYGFTVIEDKTVYFDKNQNGNMAKGLTKILPEYSDGQDRTCYFDKETGEMTTGWVTESLFETGAENPDEEPAGVQVRYYFDAENNGSMATGLTTIKEDGQNALYLFSDAGIQQTGLKKVGDDTYYFDADDNGRAQKGLVMVPADQNEGTAVNRFFGDDYKMSVGFQTAGSDSYYFDEFTGDMVTGFKDVKQGDKTYKCYFKEDGKMAKGHLQIGQFWYHFDETTGDMSRNGLTKLADGTYYYEQTGKRFHGQIQIGNDWYYMNPDTGKMATGIVKVSGDYTDNRQDATYFYNSEGKRAKGWQTANNKSYYFGDDYRIVTGWRDINGQRYYFHGTGEMATGWQTLDGHTYYFKSDGIYVRDTMYDIDGKKYGFDANGWQCKNGTFKIGGQTRTFDANGNLVSGFYEEGGVLKFVGDNGEMAINKTLTYKGKYNVTGDGNGQVVLTDTLNFPAYSQRNIYDGEHACTPTSTAMAVQFLTGQTVTPTDMQTHFRNMGKYTVGIGTTDTSAVLDGAALYGVSGRGIGMSASEAANALIRGDIIVGTSCAAPWVASASVQHTMVLHSYNKSTGQTYVQDPYTPSLSQWYDLNTIISKGSNTTSGCTTGNGPWYALSKN